MPDSAVFDEKSIKYTFSKFMKGLSFHTKQTQNILLSCVKLLHCVSLFL